MPAAVATCAGSPLCEAQASASSSWLRLSASAAPLATSGKACSTLTAERGKIGRWMSPSASTPAPSASNTASAPRCADSTALPRWASTSTGFIVLASWCPGPSTVLAAPVRRADCRADIGSRWPEPGTLYAASASISPAARHGASRCCWPRRHATARCCGCARWHEHCDFDSLAQALAAPGPGSAPSTSPSACRASWSRRCGWPLQWLPLMRHYQALSRAEIRATFKAFCDARPAGGKFAHRACDRPAGSSPSMKWVNPPVAYMLHAGVPLLDRCRRAPARPARRRPRPRGAGGLPGAAGARADRYAFLQERRRGAARPRSG